jgi:hypothetical protein
MLANCTVASISYKMTTTYKPQGKRDLSKQLWRSQAPLAQEQFQTNGQPIKTAPLVSPKQTNSS